MNTDFSPVRILSLSFFFVSVIVRNRTRIITFLEILLILILYTHILQNLALYFRIFINRWKRIIVNYLWNISLNWINLFFFFSSMFWIYFIESSSKIIYVEQLKLKEKKNVQLFIFLSNNFMSYFFTTIYNVYISTIAYYIN